MFLFLSPYRAGNPVLFLPGMVGGMYLLFATTKNGLKTRSQPMWVLKKTIEKPEL